jgi:hypothetical protein
MSKLFRRSSFVFLMIAALALLVGAPAGAFAAGEEYSSSSASGGAVVEPSGDSAQGAPDSTEWSPQGTGGGASSGGAAPLQRGSSVGSGVVPEKAKPKSEAPSYSPESGGSYEPEPTTPSQTSSPSPPPSAFEEPASTPRADSGSQSEQPAATTAPKASRAVDVEVGAADAVAHAAPPQSGSIDSVPTAAAPPFAGPDDGASAGSYTLPLLLIILLLGVTLGYAFVRLRRHRQRQRLEALWREQDAVWEAALRRAELGQVAGDSEPSAQPLRRISVG